MRDFLRGVALFGRSAGILLRSPKLLLIGALPAVVTTALLATGLVALLWQIEGLAAVVTPFADSWAQGWRIVIRIAAGIVLVGTAVVVGLTLFTALTLALGGPFYEHIAEKVEDDLGAPASDVELPWWRLLWMGIRDGVLLMLRALVFTIPLIAAGFIPVVGQTVVPVLMALVTAWFFALELVAVSFYRRGMGLTQRRKLLARRRALALGLGVPASLLCVIPLVAIVVMPVAFVGGVLVAHEVLRSTQNSTVGARVPDPA